MLFVKRLGQSIVDGKGKSDIISGESKRYQSKRLCKKREIMIHCGFVYLIVKDMKKSLAFYRSLPEKEVSAQNGERFAVVHTGNLMLCLYYGRYDMENPAKVSYKGSGKTF